MANGPHESTPISALRRVSDLLATITVPGAFATLRATRPNDLRLTVKGVGQLAWPMKRADAQRLIAVARPARYGLRDETRLDRQVRDAWEIPRSRIRIDQHPWQRTLQPILATVRRDLGLPDGTRLRAALHNMLVYQPGQFFRVHQDSEKADDMIGTLVVILPSGFTGGALVLEHDDEKRVFQGIPGKLAFVAFYADCHHQVRPVRTGYRVALTYNLVLDGQGTLPPVPPAKAEALVQAVDAYFRSPPRPAEWGGRLQRGVPDHLVHLLDHQYTQRSLGWHRLKSGDATRMAALRDVARRLDCEIALALADVHEHWSSEDEEVGDWACGRHGQRWVEDDDEGDDEEMDGRDAGEPELVELLDSDIELRHWIDEEGRAQTIASGIDPGEVCWTRASTDFGPFASEHEGYMGNWGNTVDRWYHRAAVVLWPRARTFAIRAKVAPGWAATELLKMASGRGGLDEARQRAGEIVPFWAQIARGEAARGFFGRLLGLAQALQDPALGASLLQPLALEGLTPKEAPRLAALCDQFGLGWCQAVVTQWAPDERRVKTAGRDAWLVRLPQICQSLRAGGSAPATKLARWLVARQWNWLVDELTSARDLTPPMIALDALKRLAPATLGVLEASVVSNDPGLAGDIVGFLTSDGAAYPIGASIHLLRTAYDRHAGQTLHGLGLDVLHAHSAAHLTARLQTPVREPDNWSIEAPHRCRCAVCGTLARFLTAAEQVQVDWPLAKDGRAHVHGVLDADGLPVTHVTRRAGRPFTLILRKTAALFEREAQERRAWQEDLVWLTRTTDVWRP